MPKKVAVIDTVFFIEGTGTILCLPKEEFWSLKPGEDIYRRERIQIRRPDGTYVSTYIKNLEFINRGRENGSISLSLPHDISPNDIPSGSELWLERDDNEPVLD